MRTASCFMLLQGDVELWVGGLVGGFELVSWPVSWVSGCPYRTVKTTNNELCLNYSLCSSAEEGGKTPKSIDSALQGEKK